MSDIQNLTFRSVLAAWRTRQELRRSGTTISELSASHLELDGARQAASMAIR